MHLVVNLFGMLTVGLCAGLLLRAWARGRQRLLLWCGLCFAGLAASNAVLILDLWAMPDVSLYRSRLAIAAVSMLVMLYGLIFESDPS